MLEEIKRKCKEIVPGIIFIAFLILIGALSSMCSSNLDKEKESEDYTTGYDDGYYDGYDFAKRYMEPALWKGAFSRTWNEEILLKGDTLKGSEDIGEISFLDACAVPDINPEDSGMKYIAIYFSYMDVTEDSLRYFNPDTGIKVISRDGKIYEAQDIESEWVSAQLPYKRNDSNLIFDSIIIEAEKSCETLHVAVLLGIIDEFGVETYDDVLAGYFELEVNKY